MKLSQVQNYHRIVRQMDFLSYSSKTELQKYLPIITSIESYLNKEADNKNLEIKLPPCSNASTQRSLDETNKNAQKDSFNMARSNLLNDFSMLIRYGTEHDLWEKEL